MSPALIEAGWAIEEEFGFSFWDSLIVAAARAIGCGTLLSEDMQDGQEIGGLRIVDPFQHEPSKLGLDTSD